MSDSGKRLIGAAREALILAKDAEITRLRAELEAVRPKKFVSPPGTFEIAELSDTIESGGKVYINYDDFMEVLHRHKATERALATMTQKVDEAFNAGIEAGAAKCAEIRTAIANGPMPEGARFDYEQAVLALINTAPVEEPPQ